MKIDDKQAYAMRQEGATLAAIGEHFNVSRQAVHIAITRHEAFIRDVESGWPEYMTGKAKSIMRARFGTDGTPEDLLAMADKIPDEKLLSVPNIGHSTLMKIRRACRDVNGG